MEIIYKSKACKRQILDVKSYSVWGEVSAHIK